MSDRWVRLGSTLAVATLGLSACATTGSMNNDGWRASPGQAADSPDDQGGPRLTIRASFSSFGGSREINSVFHADQDAYVLVGHIDADGDVRIVYPKSPEESGFVRGGHSVAVAPFWGGFESDYAMRRMDAAYYPQSLGARFASYDGGTGYVFAIATYHPMKLDELAAGDAWASYHLEDERDLQDPRGAVETLAEALTATSGDDYTIEFAHYFRSNAQTYATSYYAADCINPYAMRWGGYAFSSLYGFGVSPWSFGNYAYDPYGFGSYGPYAGGCGYGDQFAAIGFYPGFPGGYVVPRRYPVTLRPRDHADSAAVDSLSYRQRAGFRGPMLPGAPNDLGLTTPDLHGGMLMGGSIVDAKSAPRPLRAHDVNGDRDGSATTRRFPDRSANAARDHDEPPPRPPREAAPREAPRSQEPRQVPPPRPAPAPPRTDRHP